MSTNTCGDCQVSELQEHASSVAGQIGTVRAKVEIWENDPFLARPNQITSFPFSNLVSDQVPDSSPNLEWMLNSAYLKPRYSPHDMFVCTYNPALEDEFVNPSNGSSILSGEAKKLDFVGSKACNSGQIAGPRLPGGETYENDGVSDSTVATTLSVPIPTIRYQPNTGKHIFPHQLWIHIGSLLKRGVAIHPSEYSKPLANIIATKSIETTEVAPCNGFTIDEIEGAVKWDYVEHTEDGASTYWPYQITKQAPGRGTPVHWTLEKFVPVFQGQDFFVTVETKKETDETPDFLPEDEHIGSCIDDYKYLMYDNSVPPNGEWIDGISNSAHYVAPKRGEDGTIDNAAKSKAKEEARKQYWWKYKSYILIEIGSGHPDHNYFIELVKGRKPRFLHLGYVWDHPNRLRGGVIEPIPADPGQTNGWHFIKQCRELSVYDRISCNELFKKDSFRLAVRNHLGRIVITFEGYEGDPWVIQRLDNEPEQFDFRKGRVPLIVPAAKLRIHGGNLSCVVNYSPMRYASTETTYFRGREADTGEATNSDLWMTFSHMGSSQLYQNPTRVRRIFNDPRLNTHHGKVGYDSDAHTTWEIHRNSKVAVPLYNIYRRQYQTWGKGWILDVDRDEADIPVRDPDTGLTTSKKLVSGFKEGFNRLGGSPHSLTILNALQPTERFRFGLAGQADANYPYKDKASKWDVAIRFDAGSVLMPKAETTNLASGRDQSLFKDKVIIIDDRAQRYLFENCVTPIATSWRLIVLGGEKPTRKSDGSRKIDSFDIADLTTKITDGWTADGWYGLQHKSQVTCYIPLSPPSGDNQALYRLGQRLKSLHNKAFYVTISYWWDNGVGERDAVGNTIRRKRPELNDLLIQMSGIAYGGTLSRSVNKIFFDFTVLDYMSVFEKQFIFNSPFFDGVSDVEAVYELARMAGFDDQDKPSSRVNRQPLGLLQHIIKNQRRSADGKFLYNGENVHSPPYDLPGSYATLAAPSVKFQNGETYASALQKIAQLAAKVIYFDRWGVLRTESVPAIEAAFFAKEDGDFRFDSVFDFVTSPFPVRARDTGAGATAYRKFEFDPCQHASHLVYDVVQYNRSVEDCVNQIIILTASNDIILPSGDRVDGGFIIEGYTFFEQIWNPEEEGFLGFRKPFYQSNGIFGGLQGVRRGLQHYAKMKYPPATIQFSTYGVPGLKALDIITLDDNLFYITDISHEIDPSQNRWWMNITGEWLKPFLGDLGFLEERKGPGDPVEEEEEGA